MLVYSCWSSEWIRKIKSTIRVLICIVLFHVFLYRRRNFYNEAGIRAIYRQSLPTRSYRVIVMIKSPHVLVYGIWDTGEGRPICKVDLTAPPAARPAIDPSHRHHHPGPLPQPPASSSVDPHPSSLTCSPCPQTPPRSGVGYGGSLEITWTSVQSAVIFRRTGKPG